VALLGECLDDQTRCEQIGAHAALLLEDSQLSESGRPEVVKGFLGILSLHIDDFCE
jgi:hypothetical protein